MTRFTVRISELPLFGGYFYAQSPGCRVSVVAIVAGLRETHPINNPDGECLMATAQPTPRQLTPAELAVLVKLYRELRKWSQEQLADISGLSPRTVQRVKEGLASSTDTRRALARAFDIEDIDVFNKAHVIPTAEQLAEEKTRFEKERITLQGQRILSGKQLGKMVELSSANMFSEAVELKGPGNELFARLTDYCREYADCDELYSATDKLGVYEDFDELLAGLKKAGVTLVGAVRDTELKVRGTDAVVGRGILYVVAFLCGDEIEELAVPRDIGVGFI